MVAYTYAELASILGVAPVGSLEGEVREVCTDSRLVMEGTGVLFFALKGERHDGHHYVEELYHRAKVRVFVLSDREEVHEKLTHATIFYVPNTLVALQRWAAHHRARFKIPILGITGSNGKTIVKEWIVQLLSSVKWVHHSPKSYNSQVGVPLSLLGLNETHTAGVYEAGISQRGEMAILEQMLQPTVGLFTNLGDAHAAGFTSLAEKCQEKLLLFRRSERLIVSADHMPIFQEAQQYMHQHGVDLITWTLRHDIQADLRIELHKQAQVRGRVPFTAFYEGNRYTGLFPGVDQATIENAIEAMLGACELGLSIEQAVEGVAHLQAVPMRLERRVALNGHALVNDSYSLDMVSLQAALDFLEQQDQHSERAVILSDFPVALQDNSSIYHDVAALLQQRGVKLLAGVGPAWLAHRALFPQGHFYETTEHFLREFDTRLLAHYALLVKGSRAYGFERISHYLESQVHRTVLEINLTNLEHNLNLYRAQLKPGVRILVLVKAFAYGGGAKEIAQMLEYHRVDYLGVAFIDEGIALRREGIKMPILVLNPEPDSLYSLMEYRLEPSIFSTYMLHAFIQVLHDAGVEEYPIHLKLDTGMHRVGFIEEELPSLVNYLCSTKRVKVRSVFTHLAAADDPVEDAFTLQQLQRFSRACDTLAHALPNHFLRHALNTAGIERFSAYQFDMVRLGIGLHGIVGSSPSLKFNLKPVATLRSFIAQIRTLSPGETVGYGRKGVVHTPSTIAVIPIGYADGYSRRMGHGVGRVKVGEQLVPTVGNICMDTCMIDVTGLNVQEGDTVEFFGQSPTLAEVAKQQGTIPYEVISCISSRVPRVYISE